MSTQDWPPQLDAAHEQVLLDLASDYALSHGLVLRPVASSPGASPSQTSAIHAPYSLYPSALPRHLFEQALALQPAYNELYARVTADDEFLEQVVGGAVSKVDEFQGRLYEIWKAVKAEGIKQPLSLGLFRSDYLVHAPEGTDPSEHTIKQVEFNTISSSFGALSTRVGELHRYLLASGAYPPHSALFPAALPQNAALAGLAGGLAAAHTAYGVEEAVVLMVTQDNERNAFDQRPLEYELVEKHGIRLLRVPFSELRTTLSLSPSHSLLYHAPHAPSPVEISLVYYRTAYAPTDYYTPAEWATRLLIERSRAVKCPSVGMQLAGAKKVQQVLASPSELSRFVPSPDARAQLEASFTGLYPLDDSPAGRDALRRARDEPEGYVLKPQREGGGNNIYRGDIPPFLAALEAEDAAKGAEEPRGREGYILMSLIEPPRGVKQVLVKAGEAQGAWAEVVSELGVYGVVLLREDVEGSRGGEPEVLVNETVGHLLRTKASSSDEGGVAVGFSVIDSPLLV
ncbi:Glutathione synthetase [Rhodotorula kratochvilovae]